jgi:alpha-L-fucosidase
MLGLSPNKRGVIDDVDTQILTAFGKDLKLMFSGNIVDDRAMVSASSEMNTAKAHNVKSAEMKLCWRPAADDKTPTLHIQFNEDEPFDKIVLSENIVDGQHIEAFEIQYLNEKGKWKTLYEGTSVGYKRICSIKPIKCRELKIIFKKYRDFFELSHLQIN